MQALRRQRAIGWVLAPIWVPATALLLRIVGRYRIENAEEVRREYRRIRAEEQGPLLLCANHLTLIDSALIAWALGSVAWYLRNYSALPWNVPEAKNFAASIGQRVASYVMKCIPITRGGDRSEVARVLSEFAHVIGEGDVGLVFPEGGRSRSGKIDLEAAAPGVGRIVNALPGCKVLCIYLRGDRQTSFSSMPELGDRFHVELRLIEPKSEHRGLRGSREISRQIVTTLGDMESRWLATHAAEARLA